MGTRVFAGIESLLHGCFNKNLQDIIRKFKIKLIFSAVHCLLLHSSYITSALGRPCRRSNKLHPGRLGGPTRYRGFHAGDDRGWAAPEPQPHCVPPVLKLLQNIFFLEVCFGAGRHPEHQTQPNRPILCRPRAEAIEDGVTFPDRAQCLGNGTASQRNN